jgi:hypothetical protein
MVPEKYRLAAVGRYLVEAFERRRPAIKAWDAATEETLRAEADAAIAQMQQQLHEMGMDDPTYWVKVGESVRKVVIPRYMAMAREENERAGKDYGLWRGGDIVARATFAGVGLVLGAAAVAIPWIPVTEKWVPWLLFVGGPFVPDAYFWWYHRRYQKKIERLLGELAQAGESLETYRPLSEVQRTLEGPADVAADERAPGERTPTRG